jgi:two-component system sensor histidine kinase YesM
MKSFIKKAVLSFRKMSLKKRLILLIAIIITFSVTLSNLFVMKYSLDRMVSLSKELMGNTIDQVSNNVNEVLVSRVYTISNLIMRDEIVYNMIKYKNYSLAQSMITLPDDDRDLRTNKVLFASYVSKKYLLPTSGIKIAAFYSKDNDITSVSYSEDLSDEALAAMDRLVEDAQNSNISAVFAPTQKNFFFQSTDPRENYVILAACPLIWSDTGENYGTVILSILEKDIFSTYSNITLGYTDEIFIFTGNGQLISSSNKDRLESLKVENYYTKLVNENQQEAEYLDEDGQSVMVVTRPLKGTKWFVAGKVPVAEISRNANVLLTITVIMVAAAIIISLIFISFIAESIVRPVRRIIDAMNKAEAGDLDVSVEVSGQYEISEIAKYFNSMIARIRRLIKEEYETEKKKKEAEMNVLMGQINPHFLYNTLESIVWKAQLIGETQISEMAASLGRLYRLSVNKGTLQVKVSEELEHVKAYTDIQKLRYKNKFDCEFIVEDKSLLDYLTLKMILQPIVENSIIYCVEKTSMHIKIIVEVRKEEENLVFSVKDNGIGMTTEEVIKLRQKIENYTIQKPGSTDKKPRHYKGIGLKNIDERIKLYFGKQYGISIESQKNIGTTVSVTVPIIKDGNFVF